MSDFTPTPTPSYSGKLRNHMLMVPECINECSGIRIFGRTIKSFVFSTDVATIASVNADAVIAVYPFTPQPRIVRAVISVADMPVFCGVGGGFTSGARSVAQAMEAEHCGAYGVVLNAPVSADILRDIKSHIDIPVVATIVSATQDTEATASCVSPKAPSSSSFSSCRGMPLVSEPGKLELSTFCNALLEVSRSRLFMFFFKGSSRTPR